MIPIDRAKGLGMGMALPEVGSKANQLLIQGGSEVVERSDEIDQELIERTVTFIKDKVSTALVTTAIEIGDFLLENFFENNIDLATSKNPKKSMSYRKLCLHPQLPLQPTTLSEMVRIAAQERFLTQNGVSTDSLLYTHRLYLAKLPNDEDKLQYVNRIIENSMSGRAVKSLVRDRKSSLLGKSFSVPEIDMDRLTELFLELKKVPDSTRRLNKIDKDEAERILNTANLAMKSLNEVRTFLSELRRKMDQIIRFG